METWGVREIVFVGLAVLSTYLLGLMGANFDGPFGVASFIRRRVVAFGERRKIAWIVEGVQCPYCMTFWFGTVMLPFAATALHLVALSEIVLVWFGIVGGAWVILVSGEPKLIRIKRER